MIAELKEDLCENEAIEFNLMCRTIDAHTIF
jgi:hypothetical protein